MRLLPAALSARTTRQSDGTSRAARGLKSRRAIAIPAVVAVLALGGGTIAHAVAHKTISVDVDGEVTSVSTYAGSVDGLLRDQGIEVGTRDTVAPEESSALRDGTDVVVRHATLVRVLVDGAETDVWTTALHADEALATLVTRGTDVRLVASRSASGARAELPIDLTLDGPVDVVVDGQTRSADGTRGLPAALDELGITLSELDRVSIQRPAAGTVTVIINRVVVADVTETLPIAFTSSEQPDPNLYTGSKAVAVAGVEGQQTLVHRVTTVDGAETARELLSDTVSVAPVNEVVNVGTKARPAPKPKPAPAPARAATGSSTGSSSSSSSGSASAPAAASAGAGSLNWAALAQCESGGRVSVVSASGKYHGLYQFSVATWNAVGGSGLPSQASAEEQTARAKALYDRAGAGQWPHCGPRLFS